MSNTAHPCYNVDIKRNIVENNNGKRKDLWKSYGICRSHCVSECRKRIYSVSFGNDDGEVTCVGNFNYITEGELLEITGEYVTHSVYGNQLKVMSHVVKEPEDLVSIERYLGSGAVKGIGAALAGRIVRKFKEDTFRIIEEEPERLAEIKGISERKAREISSQLEDKRICERQ